VYMFEAGKSVQALKNCIFIEYMPQFKGALFTILPMRLILNSANTETGIDQVNHLTESVGSQVLPLLLST
jgi:hypothetical protein